MLLVSDDSPVVEVVRFPAGPPVLEGRLSYPESMPPCGAVVFAGPHPLLGGDLDNNVIRGVSDGLARRGLAVLAFNYHGVGGSDGDPADTAIHLAEFWATSRVPEEPGYADDLRAAVAAAGEMVGNQVPLAVVGYSFGCSILPLTGVGEDVPLVLIAPTVGTHDYAGFTCLPNPILVIAPDRDFAADTARVSEWFASLGGRPKQLVFWGGEDHFFRGREERLAGAVADFLRGCREGETCR